jgi:hypothetical protein
MRNPFGRRAPVYFRNLALALGVVVPALASALPDRETGVSFSVNLADTYRLWAIPLGILSLLHTTTARPSRASTRLQFLGVFAILLVRPHTGVRATVRLRLLIVCVLVLVCEACRPATRPLATRFDAVLDSLTPGLRLGDSAVAVQRKLPQFTQISYAEFHDSSRVGPLGPTVLTLGFDVSQGSKEYARPSPWARLEEIVLTLESDSQLVAAARRIESWLAMPPDTACLRRGPDSYQRLIWRSDSTAFLEVQRPTRMVSPGSRLSIPYTVSIITVYAPALTSAGPCET